MNVAQRLLADGVDTTFPEIESTMARLAAGERPPVVAARSLNASATATVVVVGPQQRLIEAADALRASVQTGGIRSIFIAGGELCTPAVRVTSTAIALDGLRAEFIDNAVASLRLPSLPTLVWWRGGDPAQTDDLARLADRLVLDAENPEPAWARIDVLVKEAPISDLRWTALTRWRALMAHFFDIPDVLAASSRFTRLTIQGSDRHSARLLASWLTTSFKEQRVEVRIETHSAHPIDAVVFGNSTEELSLRRLPGSKCVEGRARIEGHEASRVTPLGDQTLPALMAEELRVRARDLAFEQAVRRAGAAS